MIKFRLPSITFFTILICLSGLQFSANAQNPDSLKKILAAHPARDIARAKLLMALVDLYQDSNLDTMVFYAQEALTVSDEAKFDSGRSESLSHLGLACLRKSDYPKSLDYYHRALTVYRRMRNFGRQANIYLAIADIYYSEEKKTEAIDYYRKGITIFDSIGNATGKGFAMLSLSEIYGEAGNYAEALNCNLQALNALEKDNYTPGVGMALVAVAGVYSTLGDDTNAAKYLARCESLDFATATREQKLYIFNNIGNTYNALGQFGKALVYYNRARALADSVGDGATVNGLLANIADMHYRAGLYDTAFAEYTEAFRIAAKLHDSRTQTFAGKGLGDILLKHGKPLLAVEQLSKTMELARQNQLKQLIFECALALSSAYEQLHDYPKALQYHKLYFNYRDSLFDEKADKRVKQLQFEYDLGQKENQIRLLEKDKIIALNNGKKERLIVWALFAGCALMYVVMLLMIRNRRIERKAKDSILAQKLEIEQQKMQLEELNRFKDKTFSVLSHDLRGPLYALATTMAMLDEEQISPAEFAALKPEVNEQLASLNMLMDNLLNWAKSYIQGQTLATPARTDISQAVQRTLQLVKGSAEKKGISIAVNIVPPVIAWCDPELLDIVVRNLVMNALKFTSHNGAITIAAQGQPGVATISITDTGVGMTREQVSKLFIPVAGNTTYGTDGEKGTGLGLLLCMEFMKANNGTIVVESEQGKGSTFTISLPAYPDSQTSAT